MIFTHRLMIASSFEEENDARRNVASSSHQRRLFHTFYCYVTSELKWGVRFWKNGKNGTDPYLQMGIF